VARWVNLATLAILVAPAAASAATYQVGPGRSFTTPAQVARLLKPGDVVEIDGGATYAGGVLFSSPGTSFAPIVIRGIKKDGKRPVLSGGVNTIEAAGNHYRFEGLEITGGSSRCFYHHAHDIVLRDSIVRNCPSHGVLGADSGSGSLTLEQVEVFACGEGLYRHQIYMATDETAYPGAVFRMQHCYVHDGAGGNNVKSRAERNELYYNWIEGAVYHELELIGPDGQNEARAREDSDVVGNVLVKTRTSYVVRFGGDGTGQTHGRYRFVNNTVLVRPGGAAVFRLFDGIESLSAHNNVLAVAGGGGLDVLRMVEARWTSGSPKISGSNNWVPAGSSNVPPVWSGTVSGQDPRFRNAAAFDLVPDSTSPLVNAGAATTPDPSGYAFPRPLALPGFEPPPRRLATPAARVQSGAIDIGAYELAAPPTGSGGSGGTVGSGGSSGGGAGSGGSSGGSAGGGGSSGAIGASGGAPSGSGGVGGAAGGGGDAGAAGSDSGLGGAAGTAGSGNPEAGSAGESGASNGQNGVGGAGQGAGGGTSSRPPGTGGEFGQAINPTNETAPHGDGLEGGCACETTPSRSGTGFALLLAGLLAATRRRRA
jgi:MYXO-CTERM domain-containing protein